MFAAIGYTLIGGSIILAAYPAFESVFLKNKYQERKNKENLQKAFIMLIYIKSMENTKNIHLF